MKKHITNVSSNSTAAISIFLETCKGLAKYNKSEAIIALKSLLSFLSAENIMLPVIERKGVERHLKQIRGLIKKLDVDTSDTWRPIFYQDIYPAYMPPGH